MQAFPAIISSFFQDTKFAVVAVLVVVDIALGVIASVKTNTFGLQHIAAFLRDDVLFKVAPWFILYSAAKLTGNATAVFGVDFNVIADGAWVVVLAALVGSLASSLMDLGINLPAQLGRAGTPVTATRVVQPPIE